MNAALHTLPFSGSSGSGARLLSKPSRGARGVVLASIPIPREGESCEGTIARIVPPVPSPSARGQCGLVKSSPLSLSLFTCARVQQSE